MRVPLNQTAKEIASRYKGLDGDKLLPFISEQKYNLAIKRIFKAAGLKRLVTVINPTTREEEKRVLLRDRLVASGPPDIRRKSV